jgi:8-oxo-dGTP pyrophosphatase MutT (NUDIX family)
MLEQKTDQNHGCEGGPAPAAARPAVPVVNVPTVTMILHAAGDASAVVIGWNSKHAQPVLPGGKIDAADLIGTGMLDGAWAAAKREIAEELGCSAVELSFRGRFHDPGRDVRIVPARTLRATLVGAEVAALDDTAPVEARYGNPDYVFFGAVNPSEVKRTAELHEVAFVDATRLPKGTLAAGHDAYLEMYRRAIRNLSG